MWGFDLDWWNTFMLWSLGLAALAAICVVITTRVVIVLQGNEAEAAAERIASLEKETAQAHLETERLRAAMAYRRLNREAFVRALQNAPKLPVEIMYLRDDSESMEFAQEIANFLGEGGWRVLSREPIPHVAAMSSSLPTTMAVGGQPTGVTVVANKADIDARDMEVSPEGLADPQKIAVFSPYGALHRALLIGVGMLRAHVGGETAPKPGILRIVVAPREGIRQ